MAVNHNRVAGHSDEDDENGNGDSSDESGTQSESTLWEEYKHMRAKHKKKKTRTDVPTRKPQSAGLPTILEDTATPNSLPKQQTKSSVNVYTLLTSADLNGEKEQQILDLLPGR
jgi:hypothetical protein